MWVNRDELQKNHRKRNVKVESYVLPSIQPHSYLQEPDEGWRSEKGLPEATERPVFYRGAREGS